MWVKQRQQENSRNVPVSGCLPWTPALLVLLRILKLLASAGHLVHSSCLPGEGPLLGALGGIKASEKLKIQKALEASAGTPLKYKRDG